MLGNPGTGPQCPSGTLGARGQAAGGVDGHGAGTFKRRGRGGENGHRVGDRDPEREKETQVWDGGRQRLRRNKGQERKLVLCSELWA